MFSLEGNNEQTGSGIIIIDPTSVKLLGKVCLSEIL